MRNNVKSAVELGSEHYPRICILCCHTDEYAAISETTIYQNKGEYAKRHGYALKVMVGVSRFKDNKSHVGGITWERLDLANEIAKSGEYDWIYVVGGDTLITNMTIPLTQFIDDNYHFIIANDCNEWNADSFLIRCSGKATRFLDEVMAQYDRLKHHCWVEQQAMIEVRDRHPIWKVLPQRSMNSYDYNLYPAKGGRDGKDFAGNDGQWQLGDFLIHWAGLQTHIRCEQIEKIWNQIVR